MRIGKKNTMALKEMRSYEEQLAGVGHVYMLFAICDMSPVMGTSWDTLTI